MLGIVCGSISGISVIDIDTEEGKQTIAANIPTDFAAPTVYTPRGGYHLYCRYVDGIRNKAKLLNGIDIRGEGGYVVAPPSINEEGKKYTWDKIKRLGKIPLPDFPNTLSTMPGDTILDAVSITDVGPSLPMFADGRRDEDLFHVANVLVRGGMETEKLTPIMEILAKNCIPPFSGEDAVTKLRSAIERAVRRERNFIAEIKEWINLQKGIFLASELAKTLHFNGPDDLKGMAKALNSLVEAGFIARVGQRAGVFRRIESTRNLMDWRNAVIKPFEVIYPLELHQYFQTYCKNVIVVAGVKDAGKTTFMLEFIKKNMQKYKINYFTNELSDEELKLRLQMHSDVPIEDWNFNAYYISDSWQDAIAPDDINIIDYLERNEDFSGLGDTITEIHNKLNKGIALVGIQKNYGATLGVGGQFSIHKARMYITLGDGKMKVLSMKNKVPGSRNIVGLTHEYVLEDGWKVHPVGSWHYEEEKKYERR